MRLNCFASRRRAAVRGTATVFAASVLAVGLSACVVDNSDSASSSSSVAEDGTLTVFATTGYIGDAVSNIAPDANVIVMVGPGGDPHTYQPTTQDLAKIQDSDVVLWTGPDMESHMEQELESQGDRQYAVTEAIQTSELLPWEEHESHDHGGHGEEAESGEGGHEHGKYDPHIWNSTANWKHVVDGIAKKLGEVDKEHADTYIQNAAAYQAQIDETAAYVQEQINAIPQERRVLVTGHDTFNYFGKEFGLEIRATDLVTSESELGASELSELADFIAERKIPVIFEDNSANPQAINSLKEQVQAKHWDVRISDRELFADSLSAGPPANTYIGVMRYNAETISSALAQ